MCGIAGIMFKKAAPGRSTGQALIDMLDGCQHRGPDSTGFALYGEAKEGQLKLRFHVGEGDAATQLVTRIREALAKHSATVVDDEVVGNNYRVTIQFDG